MPGRWVPISLLNCIYSYFIYFFINLFQFFPEKIRKNDTAFLCFHKNSTLMETLVELRKIHFRFACR